MQTEFLLPHKINGAYSYSRPYSLYKTADLVVSTALFHFMSNFKPLCATC